MDPFYFGPPTRRLFGCYHAPPAGGRDSAVVLCHPMGHEYIQFHRALQQLAALLCGAGFPVLRFDFRGCGDSEGETEDGGTAAWLEDLDLAVAELHRRAGSRRAVLAGMRLGGTLAAMTAASRDDVDALVLWDPVINGRDYLEEMTQSHDKMLRYAHVKPRSRHMEREILGFALPEGHVSEFGEMDLLSIDRRPVPRVLIVESNDRVAQGRLKEKLAGTGAAVTLRRFSNPHLWAWIEDFGKIHVPRKIIQSIVSWVSEECA